jgi:hypothetical protein
MESANLIAGLEFLSGKSMLLILADVVEFCGRNLRIQMGG